MPRGESVLMTELLSQGTNGKTGYTSIEGRKQGFAAVLRGLAGRVRRLRDPVVLYAVVVAVSSVGCGLTLAIAGYPVGRLWLVGALAAAAVIAERERVQLGANIEISISLLPILFAAVLYGPLAAMVVAAASEIVHFRTPYMKWVVHTSTRSLGAAVGGALSVVALHFSSRHLSGIAIATLVAALALELSDSGFAVLTSRLRGIDPRDVLGAVLPLASVSVLLYAPLAVLLIAAYERVSPLTLPLFLAPALAAQRLFGLYQDQRRLTVDLVAVNDRLERANLSFATALVATLDARDRYTAGHSAAVAIYARDIAARLELSDEQQQLAHLCGLVHDIGKIGLSAGLLEKPGALTLEERREMETHSEIGERILAKVEDYAEIARIVRHHHERWDGQGYPDGLAGEDIPLLSRIIAVADAYNAMTSDRPYRDAMPSRVARMRLAQSVESQFDTTIVAAFEAILAAATESYRIASREDFSFVEQDGYSGEPFAEVA
jgi:putative nucleotidyltransferase with HDIG domain